MVIMLTEIKIFFLISFCFIAAYTDYKSGYIYDYITYPMILMGIILSIIDNTILSSLLTALTIFAVGYPIYNLGKIGGGDIKLFMGIGALLPLYSGHILILFVVLFSSVIGAMFYGIKTIFIISRNRPKGYIFVKIISILISCLFAYAFNKLYISIIAFIFCYVCIFNIFYKNHIESSYIKEIKLEELLEDDIADLSFMSKAKSVPLDKDLYTEIKSTYPKDFKIKVYRDLPIFGPSIFVSVIICLFIMPYISNIINILLT